MHYYAYMTFSVTSVAFPVLNAHSTPLALSCCISCSRATCQENNLFRSLRAREEKCLRVDQNSDAR